MKHTSQSSRRVPAWHWAVLAAAAVMVLAGGPVALGENAAGPAPGQSEQSPWPFVPQLRHDKPLMVEGRVLDSADKPAEKAHVTLIVVLVDNALHVVRPQVLGETTSDAKGAFRATVPSVLAYQCLNVVAVARRVAYGFGFEKFAPADLRHKVTFRLRDEQPVRGKSWTHSDSICVTCHGTIVLCLSWG